ncbi:hypothetical protein SUGI_0314490 [Cryptomeria japonica]|nr:hypothetical protein SUGI_0314490 [Cryptomeria japonica]
MDRGKSAGNAQGNSSIECRGEYKAKGATSIFKCGRILESMWASGTRKPPCEAHIDEITSHLQRYGKAEAKNVYYWFRNEGTREKRRKQQSEATSM